MDEDMNIRRKLQNDKQTGFTLISLLVSVSVLGIMAVSTVATINLDKTKYEVQNAIAYGNGLVQSGITYYKVTGTYPMSNADLGLTAIPGTNYAAARLEDGKFIITIGDTNAGALNTANYKIQLASIVYTPFSDDAGHLTYTCSISNSYLKQVANVGQCSLMTPGTAPQPQTDEPASQ
ncbi:hypothetical protein WK78_26405 [Burkholderia cepacia]|nr:hypothetical protein WK78_26405 [Burkholderia cepacia]